MGGLHQHIHLYSCGKHTRAYYNVGLVYEDRISGPRVSPRLLSRMRREAAKLPLLSADSIFSRLTTTLRGVLNENERIRTSFAKFMSDRIATSIPIDLCNFIAEYLF